MTLIRPSRSREERPRGARTLTAAMTPASTGFLGLAVLVVMLQSSGGFAVELFGPDLLLATAGFVVTRSLLDSAAARSGPIAPLSWYREQLTLNAPLVVLVPLTVLVVTATAGPRVHGGGSAGDVLADLVPLGNWWELPAQAERTDQVDPLGPLWLIGLLVQFCLVWPLLLAVLHRLTDAQYERRLLTVLTPVLVLLAAGAWLVGPLRDQAGADITELAVGGHVRAVEWLVGAAAAAATLGLRASRRRKSRGEAPALIIVGILLLVAMAVVATVRPTEWLRLGGPGGAAFGAAVLLLAAHVPDDGPLARALGTGLPLELGRMAFPLLLLHSLVFWLIQLTVPEARPVALLAVGGALAWVIGLVVHDGVVRRARRHRFHLPRVPAMVLLGVSALAVATLAGGSVIKVAYAEDKGRDSATPTVLVLGGGFAAEVASALDTSTAGYTVVDGSRPGCGVVEDPAEEETPNQARTTALAQLPSSTPDCRSWPRWWATRVDAVRPDAVVLDLSVDALPRAGAAAAESPCSPAFRAMFREEFAEAVRVAGAGADDRPIFLTTGHTDPAVSVGAQRCLNALLVESVASYRSVHALPVGGNLTELPTELGKLLLDLREAR